MEPSTSGCDFETECNRFWNVLIIPLGILILSIWLYVIVLRLLYFFQSYKLRKTLAAEASELNRMLFKALLIQMFVIAVGWVIPFVIMIEVVIFKIRYASFIAQICLFFLMVYPIMEVIVLLYVVKPYREFILKIIHEMLVKLRLKTSSEIEPILFINPVAPNGWT